MFHDHTGFQLSYDKTTLYRVGSMLRAVPELYTAEGIKWSSEKLNILGVEVHTNEDELLKVNYEPLIEKSKSILKKWEKEKV